MRLGLDEPAHQAERPDQLAAAGQHPRDQRVVRARAADDRALHREPGGAVVQDDPARPRDHARPERLVQALEQRHRHPVAIDRAHADGSPGRLGDGAGKRRPPRGHVLGRQQMADVGAVADVRERVLERQRHRADQLAQPGLVAEDRERLERGDALGRWRQLCDVDAAVGARRAARPTAARYSARSSRVSQVASDDRLRGRARVEELRPVRGDRRTASPPTRATGTSPPNAGGGPNADGARGLVRQTSAQLNPAGTPSRASVDRRAPGKRSSPSRPNRRDSSSHPATAPGTSTDVRAGRGGRLGGGQPRRRPGGVDPVHGARARRARSRTDRRRCRSRVARSRTGPRRRRSRRRPRSRLRGARRGRRAWRAAGSRRPSPCDATAAARDGDRPNDTRPQVPGRPEPLGTDPARVVPAVDQPAGGCLDERVRAAYVHARLHRWRPGDVFEQRPVDPPAAALPIVRPLPGEHKTNDRPRHARHSRAARRGRSPRSAAAPSTPTGPSRSGRCSTSGGASSAAAPRPSRRRSTRAGRRATPPRRSSRRSGPGARPDRPA